jgi:hypothetical protein
MSNIYLCKCLDAKYDEPEEMLVLNCLFEELNEQKLVVFSRSDFTYKGEEVVPHVEMHRTAALFKNKRFKLDVGDDPLRRQLSEKEQFTAAAAFNKEMTDQMDQICEGLVDETKQVERKLGRMVDEGKLDPVALLKSELVIRGKLGGFEPC